MKKIIYISIFVILIGFMGVGASHVNADELSFIQVATLVGQNNSDILDQSLVALSSVLGEVQMMLNGDSEVIIDNSQAISNTLGGIKNVLASVNINVTQLAYEYIDNNSFASEQGENIVTSEEFYPIVTDQTETENGLASVSSVFGGKNVIIPIIILVLLLIGFGIWILFRSNDRIEKDMKEHMQEKLHQATTSQAPNTLPTNDNTTQN